MTTYNKTTLKTFFETNDVPSGGDYANLIDSCVNVSETAIQTMSGPLNPTELVTARVSATNVVVTGIMSAASVNVSGTLSTSILAASAAQFTGIVSAQNISIVTTISAASIYASTGFYNTVAVVSAAGTSQGTAASLAYAINRGKGVVDGVTTGFTPLTGQIGLTQYLFNEGVSANLWPPTGGTINGLAVNTPFPLAANAMVTIIHLTASAYAVK